MSRMKEVYVELSDRLEDIDQKLDAQIHLLKDMVSLEDQIKTMEEKIQHRLTVLEAVQINSAKLVDRLIEMTMVVSGTPNSAVTHRAQARLERPDLSTYWDDSMPPGDADVSPNEEWPPAGHDAMNVTG